MKIIFVFLIISTKIFAVSEAKEYSIAPEAEPFYSTMPFVVGFLSDEDQKKLSTVSKETKHTVFFTNKAFTINDSNLNNWRLNKKKYIFRCSGFELHWEVRNQPALANDLAGANTNYGNKCGCCCCVANRPH